MKRFAIVIGMMVALSGCAGKQSWENYAAEHQCERTGHSQLKTEMTSTSIQTVQPIGLGGGSISTPVPVVRRIFEYQCNNGVIWARN